MTKPDLSRWVDPRWRQQPIDSLANLVLARLPEEDVSLADRTRWRAYRSVLEAAGIDPSTLTWDERPYNAAVVRQRWVEPYAGEWDGFVSEVPGFPPLAQAEWKPVYALTYVLRRLFGLTQHPVGNRRRQYIRWVIDSATLEAQRSFAEQRERNTHAQDR